jgi:hypothetical protein
MYLTGGGKRWKTSAESVIQRVKSIGVVALPVSDAANIDEIAKPLTDLIPSNTGVPATFYKDSAAQNGISDNGASISFGQ